MIQAKVIEDSISEAGKRLTTLQLIYPRFIHAELLTHRVFSRNASSSRAIPVKKMIEMIRNEPAVPIHWGLNQRVCKRTNNSPASYSTQPRMLGCVLPAALPTTQRKCSRSVCTSRSTNRVLEPFQHISVVLTATEFDNWRELRRHTDAQPEIQHLATEIDIQRDRSITEDSQIRRVALALRQSGRAHRNARRHRKPSRYLYRSLLPCLLSETRRHQVRPERRPGAVRQACCRSPDTMLLPSSIKRRRCPTLSRASTSTAAVMSRSRAMFLKVSRTSTWTVMPGRGTSRAGFKTAS